VSICAWKSGSITVTEVDVEALAASQLLFNLSERMEAARKVTQIPRVADALAYAARMTADAAINVAVGIIDLEHADAYADAGEVTLRRLRAIE
jgi:hypothetical protein